MTMLLPRCPRFIDADPTLLDRYEFFISSIVESNDGDIGASHQDVARNFVSDLHANLDDYALYQRALSYKAIGDRVQAKRDPLRAVEPVPNDGYEPEFAQKLGESGFTVKVRKE